MLCTHDHSSGNNIMVLCPVSTLVKALLASQSFLCSLLLKDMAQYLPLCPDQDW